ncbi:MAG: hypothetical protein SXV54_17235 [Chloroflexota bacterium]|nr:hypothetical protein [Chloroflexota bacterium]
MAQFVASGIDGEEGKGLVSHVTTNARRQAVEIGLEQVLRFDPWRGPMSLS